MNDPTRATNHHSQYREGYPGEKARQGRIILNTKTRQFVFFGVPLIFLAVVIIIALVV